MVLLSPLTLRSWDDNLGNQGSNSSTDDITKIFPICLNLGEWNNLTPVRVWARGVQIPFAGKLHSMYTVKIILKYI